MVARSTPLLLRCSNNREEEEEEEEEEGEGRDKCKVGTCTLFVGWCCSRMCGRKGIMKMYVKG